MWPAKTSSFLSVQVIIAIQWENNLTFVFCMTHLEYMKSKLVWLACHRNYEIFPLHQLLHIFPSNRLSLSMFQLKISLDSSRDTLVLSCNMYLTVTHFQWKISLNTRVRHFSHQLYTFEFLYLLDWDHCHGLWLWPLSWCCLNTQS